MVGPNYGQNGKENLSENGGVAIFIFGKYKMQSQVYTRYIQFSVYTKEKLEFLIHMSF